MPQDGVEILHVFDLPQIHNKPSPQELINALTLLTSEPPSWAGSDSDSDDDFPSFGNAFGKAKSGPKKPPTKRVEVDPNGLPSWLTKIVGSDLIWIEDAAMREDIWEQASARLSERAGRTAMGDMTRTFRVPTKKDVIDITIHEPALTEDNLGLKTWASSYLLAKRLHTFDLHHLVKPPAYGILELGAGTGLVGIAAAAIFGASVCLTDLPEIEKNLAQNVMANKEVFQKHGGFADTYILDWSQPETFQMSVTTPGGGTATSMYSASAELTPTFPVILAADPLYSEEHPKMLVETISTWLANEPDARVIIELPLREAYQPEVDDFIERMEEIGMKLLDQGEETGYDDWGAGDDRGRPDEVLCWWSIWGWASTDIPDSDDESAIEEGKPSLLGVHTNYDTSRRRSSMFIG